MPRKSQRFVQRTVWLPLLVGLLSMTVWALAVGWPPAITSVDLDQPYIDTALPPPQGSQQFRQTFVPQHNGLSEVAVILVQYAVEGAAESDATFTLTLLNEGGAAVATRNWRASEVRHNSGARLIFDPVANSAGHAFTLVGQGSPNNTVSLWGYSLNALPQSQLSFTVGRPSLAQALRLTTSYTLTWQTALWALGAAVARYGYMWLAALVLWPLPGALLLQAWPRPIARWDGPTRWGIALALGGSVWPLLWLWFSLVGGRFSGPLLWVLIIGGWGAWGYLRWRQPRPTRATNWPATASLILLLLLGLAVRMLAVRDLTFLPWVDASRHALITAVLTQTGQTLQSYEPYLPVSRSPYHTGFHALPASLLLLQGNSWPLQTLLLGLMQLICALAPLTIYGAVSLLTRRPWASWVAAFLVTLPALFPSYYTTWGRLTQLMGVLMLPLLLALTWLIGRKPRRWGWSWPLLSVLIAGLFLIHGRVFLFFAPYAILVGVISLRRRGGWWQLLLAAAVAFALILPRLVQLQQARLPLGFASGLEGYNVFPTAYVTFGWERYLWGLGAVCLLLALGAAAYQQRWVAFPLLLATWAGLVYLLIAGDGLWQGWPVILPFVNVNSFYITLFVPLALVVGVTVVPLALWLWRRHWLVQMAAHVAVGVAVAGAALFGVRHQITLLNPTTFLAHTADAAAIAWVAENTPPDAKIAVNSWKWLGQAWAGVDGGAWLTPLTGRQTTVPPVDYIYEPRLVADVAAFNTAASAVEDWSSEAAAALLQQYKVTHVFVGKRSGFFDPAELARNAMLELVYAADGVYVFALRQP